MVSVLMLHSTAAAENLTESATAQISSAAVLAEQDLSANSATIKILLQQALSQLDANDPVAATLQSVILLLDTGNADSASVAVLLKSAIDSGAAESEQSGAAGADQSETVAATEALVSELGLPVYQVTSFIKTILQESVLVDVPGDWGNNASGRALTSYSPVNGSGAISPAAGTLTLSYFPMEGTDVDAAFDTYEKNIADMSVTMDLNSEDATTADLPARKIEFVMSVGANQFTCETVCFAHEQTIYAIELMQGQQTAYDYFPTYHQVVDSAKVGSKEEISEISSLIDSGQQMTEPVVQTESDIQTDSVEQTESNVQTEPVVQTESDVQTEPVKQTESDIQTEPVVQTESDVQAEPVEQTESDIQTEPVEQTESDVQTEPVVQTETTVQTESDAQTGTSLPADIGTFMYELNGKPYQFPTRVCDLAEGALPLDLQLTLPYDFSSDADMAGGSWTEIVNTQYYYFENALHKEMAGVTNMNGYPVAMSEGVLTALIDTQGDYVKVTLPGGIQVGSSEADILKGFPEFAAIPMDGTASFRGNELLYARNVRDDGCNGYVLIRNDAPYYSAVSIICENSVIKEISFECLGSVRAAGVFL